MSIPETPEQFLCTSPGALVRALGRRGIETDAETLMALPFDPIELDEEVRRLFEGP